MKLVAVLAMGSLAMRQATRPSRQGRDQLAKTHKRAREQTTIGPVLERKGSAELRMLVAMTQGRGEAAIMQRGGEAAAAKGWRHKGEGSECVRRGSRAVAAKGWRYKGEGGERHVEEQW